MEDASRVKLWNHLMQAVSFYQGASPFGIVGSTLLDREEKQNRFFQYKHQFLVHTLEDQVLMDILSAIHQKKAVSFKNNSHRSGLTVTLQGVPLKIFVSTRTGRRYLCLYLTSRQRFQNVRLDSLTEIKLLEPFSGYEKLQEKLEKHLPHCFGVSFGGRSRMEEIHMELYINEEKEGYVLDRCPEKGAAAVSERIAKKQISVQRIVFMIQMKCCHGSRHLQAEFSISRGEHPRFCPKKSQRTGNACIRCTAPEMIRTSIELKNVYRRII